MIGRKFGSLVGSLVSGGGALVLSALFVLAAIGPGLAAWHGTPGAPTVDARLA